MGTKQYDSATDLITFSRASSATFLGSNGLLQTAANNIPRIEYDATGAVKGLLVEEARTNLLSYSGAVTSTGWNVSALNVSAVTAGSPFGSYQSGSPPSTSSTEGQAYQIGKPLTSGATCVGWSLVKYSAGNGWFSVSLYTPAGFGAADNQRGWFDLQNGVVGSKDTSIIDYGMIDYGDGWWLCWASKVANSTSGGINLGVTTADGASDRNSGDVVLIAGSQFEQGAFPTSYIPTTGAPATRAKDLAEIPTSAFGYNNDKGSLVIDVLTPVADQLMTLAIFNTFTYNESRSLWKSNSVISAVGNDFVYQTHDGATTKFAFGQQTQAVYAKIGLSYGDSERAVKDGGTVVSGDSRSPSPTRLHLGGRDNGFQSQCWIKSIQYYPRRLTDTQLQELTT